ncbi:MAG: SPOR domain-containing protein [Pseudomonadota bacterium]
MLVVIAARLENVAFALVGFLVGISAALILAGQSSSSTPQDVPSDIFASSGPVRVSLASPTKDSVLVVEQEALQTSPGPSSDQSDAIAGFEKMPERPAETTEQALAEVAQTADWEGVAEPSVAEAEAEAIVKQAAVTLDSIQPAAAVLPEAEDNVQDAPAFEGPEFGLHLASLSNRDNIGRMIADLEERFVDELSDRSFYEMEGMNAVTGTAFIRVVSTGYENRDAAASQCDRLKARGQYCSVIAIQR